MSREKWLIYVQLPTNLANGGRYMARVLKHLLRAWRVKCVALLDTSEQSHRTAQDEQPDKQTAHPSADAVEGS